MAASPPSIMRRLASMLYETLLVLAIIFIAGLIFSTVTHNAQSPLYRLAFQAYLVVVVGIYFIGFWIHGGQTLAMKTWRLRLARADGGPVRFRQAVLRYLLAMTGVFLLGFGIFWAVFDRDRQFWHDHVAGTRIVFAD
jgi:uncharacterized RDD family membrane protein YckC